MLHLEHSAILLTSIKRPIVIKIFVLCIFEWGFYTGFTVCDKYENLNKLKKYIFIFARKMCLFEDIMCVRFDEFIIENVIYYVIRCHG